MSYAYIDIVPAQTAVINIFLWVFQEIFNLILLHHSTNKSKKNDPSWDQYIMCEFMMLYEKESYHEAILKPPRHAKSMSNTWAGPSIAYGTSPTRSKVTQQSIQKSIILTLECFAFTSSPTPLCLSGPRLMTQRVLG